MNHKRPRETKWTYDDSRGAFTITTLKALNRGDQVHAYVVLLFNLAMGVLRLQGCLYRCHTRVLHAFLVPLGSRERGICSAG